MGDRMALPPTKIIAMLALFVVLVIIGALYLVSGGTSKHASTVSTIPASKMSTTTIMGLTTITQGNTTQKVSNILVSGKISVTGSGMTITNIAFYRTNPNITYTANVTNGKYALNLPNLQTYDVVVFWIGQYPWQKGFDPIKPMVWPYILGLVNQTNTTYNINLTLPNGVIKVNGSIRMSPPNITPSGQVLRYPTQVIFKAPNGMKFIGNVSTYVLKNQYTNSSYYLYNYTVGVPNWETYNVTIKWIGQYNTVGYCNENPWQEYAGVDIFNQTDNYVC